MANAQDKLVGSVFIAIAAFVWSYYTVWAFLMPFLDEQHPLQSFFLPQEYAVLLPTLLVAIAVTGVAGFIGMSVVKKQRKASSTATKKKST
ncbi:dolichol phosphate-mannose biosynthesis regulatory [Blastocladiella britannica]|nr:dolichol phosphate-mannose biosynthesis regulatory [Blastocladiella britannica]